MRGVTRLGSGCSPTRSPTAPTSWGYGGRWGPDGGNVLRVVASEGGRLLAMGMALGLVGSFGVGRLVAGLLFATEPTDPVTYLFACTALGLSGLLAMSLPARRATRVDPVVALRNE